MLKITLILTLLLLAICANISSVAAEDTLFIVPESESVSSIPAYLSYPNDQISEMMFGESMKEIINEECNYRFMLYLDIADAVPAIEKNESKYDIDEIHYYFKEETDAWYAISIMKTESVKTSNLCGWVEDMEFMYTAFGMPDLAIRVPPSKRGNEYKQVAFYDLGEETGYTELHGFDESHVYLRVFYLGEKLFKQFILVARRGDWSWKLAESFTTDYEEVIPSDTVPPGQTFGRFYPVFD